MTPKEYAQFLISKKCESPEKYFQKIYGYVPSDYMSGDKFDEWQNIYKVAYSEIEKYKKDYFKETVNEAFDELDKLAEKYGFNYSFGCGCCGGIYFTKDSFGYDAIEGRIK